MWLAGDSEDDRRTRSPSGANPRPSSRGPPVRTFGPSARYMVATLPSGDPV